MAQISSSISRHLLDPRRESLPAPSLPEQDFGNRLDGVVIPVWAGDLYLAKACCASVRQFMGDVPITLLVDGAETDTRALQRLHGIHRMLVHETASEEFLRLCGGTPWTKLLLFWRSPYERFLCLDADTIVWGDVRLYADFDHFDFIAAYHLSGPFLFGAAAEIERNVFDLDTVLKRDPTLAWHGLEFANSGAFFARRGIFSEAQIMELRRMNCWRCYDQGLLNYLRWRASRDGIPRAGGCRVQVFPAELTYGMEHRFLPRYCPHPAIIHWMGKKPKLGRRYRASDDYRKLFLKMTGRSNWIETRLFTEDIRVWLRRQRRSLHRHWQRTTRATA